jgi:flagellar basal-body rod protein FlgG
MQDSMYSGLFGALTNEHRLNVIANNLANVNTTGYKADKLSFKDTMIHYAHERIMQPVLSLRDKQLFPDAVHIAKPRISESKTDYTQGSLRKTDAPFDLAISGEGFFKVQTPNGDYYTRNGNFLKRADGVLVTAQGFPLLSDGGEVTIPEAATITIDGQGQIFANNENVGQIQIVNISDPSQLEKYGHNLYKLRDNAQAGEEAVTNDTQIVQGYLEAPNVNIVEEMVNMIETHRAFEAYQKMISSTQEMDDKAIQRVGKPA